jgi:hypothetical protein
MYGAAPREMKRLATMRFQFYLRTLFVQWIVGEMVIRDTS